MNDWNLPSLIFVKKFLFLYHFDEEIRDAKLCLIIWIIISRFPLQFLLNATEGFDRMWILTCVWSEHSNTVESCHFEFESLEKLSFFFFERETDNDTLLFLDCVESVVYMKQCNHCVFTLSYVTKIYDCRLVSRIASVDDETQVPEFSRWSDEKVFEHSHHSGTSCYFFYNLMTRASFTDQTTNQNWLQKSK